MRRRSGSEPGRPVSLGSMWTSEARSRMAWVRILADHLDDRGVVGEGLGHPSGEMTGRFRVSSTASKAWTR